MWLAFVWFVRPVRVPVAATAAGLVDDAVGAADAYVVTEEGASYTHDARLGEPRSEGLGLVDDTA